MILCKPLFDYLCLGGRKIVRLICSFEVVDMGDQMIAVPVGGNAEQIHGVFKLNKEAAEIIKLLNDGLEKASIIESLKQKYDNDSATINSYVNKVVENLKEIGALEEE